MYVIFELFPLVHVFFFFIPNFHSRNDIGIRFFFIKMKHVLSRNLTEINAKPDLS